MMDANRLFMKALRTRRRQRSHLNAQNFSLVKVISQFRANRSKSDRRLTKRRILWWASAIDLLIKRRN